MTKQTLRDARRWLVSDHPTPGYFIAGFWVIILIDLLAWLI